VGEERQRNREGSRRKERIAIPFLSYGDCVLANVILSELVADSKIRFKCFTDRRYIM